CSGATTPAWTSTRATSPPRGNGWMPREICSLFEPMAKTILVTGATGQQGGSVLRALQKRGFIVRALTRDPASPKAKALAEKGVEVVAGDLTDRASLDAALRGAHGAYSVQALTGKEG